MATYAPQNISMPVSSGEELRSRWASALSQSPLLFPESALTEKGVKLNPQLVSALLDTLNLMDPGGISGLLQPLGFNLIPKSVQWGKAALGSARRANEFLMEKHPTLKALFSETPVTLDPYGSLKHLGGEIKAATIGGGVKLPFMYEYDYPKMIWTKGGYISPEEYLASILAHESEHLARNKGIPTVIALEEAASKHPDLAKIFSQLGAYRNPASWPGEFTAEGIRKVAVPSVLVDRLPNTIGNDWFTLWREWLKNPNLTVEEMKKISPDLAKSFEASPYFTPPYEGAKVYSSKEIKELRKGEITKPIQRPGRGGAISSKRGGGLEVPTEPYEANKFGNKMAVVHTETGDVFIDLTNPDWMKEV